MNRIIQGDCTEVLKTIPAESVDFVLTDPPYFVRYRDRSGRSVQNDGIDDTAKVLSAFPEIYRVLKPHALCVSFYGWQAIDAFMAAWKAAGFTPVDHIVWRKSYASSTRFCNRFHEQAYVLAKGYPATPSKPFDDVQPWAYSGNRSHPTEKDVRVLKPVIQAFTQPGALVLDPFSGSGSTSVAAALAKRRYIGIELDQKLLPARGEAPRRCCPAHGARPLTAAEGSLKVVANWLRLAKQAGLIPRGFAVIFSPAARIFRFFLHTACTG